MSTMKRRMKKTTTDLGRRKERRDKFMILLFKRQKLMMSQKMTRSGKKVHRKLELLGMKLTKLVLLLEKSKVEEEEQICGSKL
jgi:hypothetical protein